MNPLKMVREFLENLKNILMDYLKSRIFPVTLIMLIMFFALGRRLFVLQIKNGDSYEFNFTESTEKTLTVESVRGNIYDVNGKLLCRQINNDIYVASEARNMIPDWSKKTTVKAKLYNKKIIERKVDNTLENTKTVVLTTGAIITAPIWIPLLWYVLSTGDWTH